MPIRTSTAAFRRYVRSIQRLILSAPDNTRLAERCMPVLTEAHLIGKRDAEVLADIEGLATARLCHEAIAAAHARQRLIAAVFVSIRRFGEQYPTQPSLAPSIRQAFQSGGVYAGLAAHRARAELAKATLAGLALAHPDLPILKPPTRVRRAITS